MKAPTALEELDEVITRVRERYPCAAEMNGMSACDSEEAGHFSAPRPDAMCEHCRAFFWLVSALDLLLDGGIEEKPRGRRKRP